MSNCRLAELNDLVGSTEIVIPAHPNLLELIAQSIRHFASDGSDSFHAIGALEEGIVHLLSCQYRQVAARKLLRRSLRSFGIVWPQMI
jgi:hypothetical protein